MTGFCFGITIAAKVYIKIVNLPEKPISVKLFFSNILLLFSFLSVTAQIDKNIKEIRGGGFNNIKSQKDSVKVKVKRLPATDYKIFTIKNDTVAVDTTLTIRDYYRFNPLFKDDFRYLSFQNAGQPLTHLSFDITTENLIPGFIADTKLTDYWTHTQVPFFKTPTPYSDLSYINGINQGQVVNSIFATNITPQINIAAGYRGLSSLGLYQHSIAKSDRIFINLNYESKNGRYKLKTYYYTYNKTNEENGGIKDVTQFEQAGDIFSDRGRIEVNLNDAENELKKRRLFAGQSYGILKNKFLLIDRATYKYHMYQFTQNKPNEVLGKSTQTNKKFKDSINLKSFENFAGLQFKIKQLKLESGIRYIYQYYSLDSLKVLNGQTYPKFLEYNDLSLDNSLKIKLGKLSLKGQLNIGFTKNIAGYYLEAQGSYPLPKNIYLSASLKSVSKRPDFKYILYQSAYDKYNWYHPEFKNELIQKLQVKFSHKNFGKFSLNQTIINNYTYFGQDSLPHQDAGGIKYTALKYQNDYHYKHWGISGEILLQKVLDGKAILSLPDYVLRGSLFYSHYYFKHNLYVQTGVTAKYFEAFYARAYNPVLADFLVQNYQKIGGYPIVDYFINFKIKRFRLYFKLQHLNALLKQKTPDYYAAPLQPYRDFNIRFGLRWIFFN